MNAVIEKLASSDIDQLKFLWRQLYLHHDRLAPHLAVLGPIRPPEESWRLRREQYLGWQQESRTAVLVARDQDRLLGYAVVRVAHAPGSWQWGDDVGVLETLVIDDEARGTGVGHALLEGARRHLAGFRIKVMKISVVAGNQGALRFYRREGASDFVETLIMPLSD